LLRWLDHGINGIPVPVESIHGPGSGLPLLHRKVQQQRHYDGVALRWLPLGSGEMVLGRIGFEIPVAATSGISPIQH
jgi:hypothetical protein